MFQVIVNVFSPITAFTYIKETHKCLLLHFSPIHFCQNLIVLNNMLKLNFNYHYKYIFKSELGKLAMHLSC